jgi:hypothetical protein
MGNTEKLEKYLIENSEKKKGYLLDDNLSNGKVIMLSGEWGSGKTYFWQNKIKDNLKLHAYISLYGKTSIESIESDLYMQIYSSANNEKDFISKACSTLFTIYGKIFKPLSVIDVQESEKLVIESKHKKAIESMQNNAVICFDDFERKSKDIDLNDLFGFITQLALNFKCKVVIILNTDVFEGTEKNVFTNVKEKSVSKYLKFDPTCEELFDMIFEKYSDLKNYKIKLKDTFSEIRIVNARILIQVLDNVREWIKENKSLVGDGDVLRYFMLANINFILNHFTFESKLIKINENGKEISTVSKASWKEDNKSELKNKIKTVVKSSNSDYKTIETYISEFNTFDNDFIEKLKHKVKIREKLKESSINNNEQITRLLDKSEYTNHSQALIDFIDENKSFVNSLHFMNCFKINVYGYSNNKVEVDILNNINGFIENGIL